MIVSGYKLTFTKRRYDSLFGTAFPWKRQISKYDKQNIVSQLAAAQHPSPIRLSVDSTDMIYGIVWKFVVHNDGKTGYDAALAIEKWTRSIKRLRWFDPPRWWYKTMPWRQPTDSFMCNEIDIHELMKWLQENCEPRDYQFYTKFQEDLSLGFRDAEHATMFKLTFGDQEI